MPIVAREAINGVDCCGRVAPVEGRNVEPRRNNCAAVAGVVQIDNLAAVFGILTVEAVWNRQEAVTALHVRAMLG